MEFKIRWIKKIGEPEDNFLYHSTYLSAFLNKHKVPDEQKQLN